MRLSRAATAAIVIPALNEEAAIGGLVEEVLAVARRPDLPVAVTGIYVVDNGSTDATAARATAAGATVVLETQRGYGRACLSGVMAADADLIVLMDGDRSDQPAELPELLAPLVAREADLVVGSRVLGQAEPGSLTPPQRFGNWVASRLLRLLFGVRVTDIGPFRVIRRNDLLALGMREMTYGWSVEMLARAARQGLRVREVPVSYRNRAGGESKVSGNLRASVRAGFRILATIWRCRLGPPAQTAPHPRHAAPSPRHSELVEASASATSPSHGSQMPRQARHDKEEGARHGREAIAQDDEKEVPAP